MPSARRAPRTVEPSSATGPTRHATRAKLVRGLKRFVLGEPNPRFFVWVRRILLALYVPWLAAGAFMAWGSFRTWLGRVEDFRAMAFHDWLLLFVVAPFVIYAALGWGIVPSADGGLVSGQPVHATWRPRAGLRVFWSRSPKRKR